MVGHVGIGNLFTRPTITEVGITAGVPFALGGCQPFFVALD